MKPQCVKRTREEFGVRIASICSYCPDKEEGDAWSASNDFEASHTVCAACLVKHFPEMPLDISEKAKHLEGTFI